MCDIFLSSDTRLVRFLANGAQITRATREIIWTVNLQFVLRERGREGGRGNGGTEEPRSLAPHLAKSDLFNPSLDFPFDLAPRALTEKCPLAWTMYDAWALPRTCVWEGRKKRSIFSAVVELPVYRIDVPRGASERANTSTRVGDTKV